MKSKRKLITFDWAMRRLLRNKASFGILDDFLCELPNEEIAILDIWATLFCPRGTNAVLINGGRKSLPTLQGYW